VTVEQLIEELQKHRKTLPVRLVVDTPEYKRVVGKVNEVRVLYEPVTGRPKVELS